MLLSYYHKTKIEAGLDEVGRGCLAGPVVAAAVIFPKDYKNPLINDSKKINALNRTLLEKEIKKNAICWKIGVVNNKEIDKLNILKASIFAMHKCVSSLEIKPELLLVDGNKFYNYPGIAHVCIIKGDSKYLSIGAASILAKTFRDRLMQKISLDYPYYNWQKNVGYPTPFHKEAIRKFGLSPFHRYSFRFVKENIKTENQNLF